MLFEYLSERALHVCGGSADDAHHPHPEYRAGSAKADRGRDADNVARADSGSGGDHQGLE